MKKAILPLLILLGTTSVAPAFSQQVVELNECVRVREVFVPGTYDRYGNYVQGYVKSERFRVPCAAAVVNPVVANPAVRQEYYEEEYRPYVRERAVRRNQIYCDPTKSVLGGVLGGGIAAGVSKKDAYKWSVPLGAFLGGATFGCRAY